LFKIFHEAEKTTVLAPALSLTHPACAEQTIYTPNKEETIRPRIQTSSHSPPISGLKGLIEPQATGGRGRGDVTIPHI